MKIIVDKKPELINECCFSQYDRNGWKCILSNDICMKYRTECVYLKEINEIKEKTND